MAAKPVVTIAVASYKGLFLSLDERWLRSGLSHRTTGVSKWVTHLLVALVCAAVGVGVGVVICCILN